MVRKSKSTEKVPIITSHPNEKAPKSTKGDLLITRKYIQAVLAPKKTHLPHYYCKSATEFIYDAHTARTIENTLVQEHRERYGEWVKEEVAYAWGHSCDAMARILEEAEMNDVMVVAEYSLPVAENSYARARRADFLLFGKDRYDQNNIVVIETKQWERALLEPSTQPGNVRMRKSGMFLEEEFPSLQAEDYAIEIVDLLEQKNVHTEFLVSSFAYLHNVKTLSPIYQQVLFDPKFNDVLETTPLYTRGMKKDFIADLKLRIENGQGEVVFQEFSSSTFFSPFS